MSNAQSNRCKRCKKFHGGRGEICADCQRETRDHIAHVGNMVTPKPTVADVRRMPPANIRDGKG